MYYLTFQTSILYDWNLFLSLPTNKKLYEIFQNLDLSLFKDKNYGHGQTGYSRHAMLRALIVKNIAQLNSVPRLVAYLKDNPFICDLCGFDSYRMPDETQFYRLIKSLDTSKLHEIMIRVNNQYYELSHTLIQSIPIDSKPVLAPTQENNPKYHQRNLTNKYKKPKHNPDAALGYYATQMLINYLRRSDPALYLIVPLNGGDGVQVEAGGSGAAAGASIPDMPNFVAVLIGQPIIAGGNNFDILNPA